MKTKHWIPKSCFKWQIFMSVMYPGVSCTESFYACWLGRIRFEWWQGGGNSMRLVQKSLPGCLPLPSRKGEAAGKAAWKALPCSGGFQYDGSWRCKLRGRWHRRLNDIYGSSATHTRKDNSYSCQPGGGD